MREAAGRCLSVCLSDSFLHLGFFFLYVPEFHVFDSVNKRTLTPGVTSPKMYVCMYVYVGVCGFCVEIRNGTCVLVRLFNLAVT